MFDTILVTGGCGAIGSEVINRLKKLYKQTKFINLDVLTYAGKKEHIEPPFQNYEFIQGSICDAHLLSYVLKTKKPNCIIHFAAETHVDNSFGNSFKFTHTNVFGTHCLLECVRQYMADGNSFQLFIHMSTDEVYGSVDDDTPALHESALFSPSNPYAATKAAAEMICHSYIKSFKLPIIVTRCNNAISKYQHHEKLIPKAISCIRNNIPIPIHGNGKSKRTFIHVYDIADAMEMIMSKGSIGSVYNIGTTQEYSVLEVVQQLLDIMMPGKDINDYINFVEDRAFQDYRYCIDCTALRSLGWCDKVSFEDALKYVMDDDHSV
jgi:dTDP-glucose 4,6-dehydratase